MQKNKLKFKVRERETEKIESVGGVARELFLKVHT